MAHSFATNSYNPADLPLARSLGFGLEVEAYLWTYMPAEIAAKRPEVESMLTGFSCRSFHGTAISRDFDQIAALSLEEVLALYNESYGHARAHCIPRLVFHGNYFAGMVTKDAWVRRETALWTRFLRDKPPETRICLENYVDECPEMMAALCDAVADPRFTLCLDTGHAACNSARPVAEWIKTLGARIRHVHLHNNDGQWDRHWPPGRGTLDMRAILRDLLELAAPETIVLECDLPESVAWLRETGYIKT